MIRLLLSKQVQNISFRSWYILNNSVEYRLRIRTERLIESFIYNSLSDIIYAVNHG